MSANWQDYFEYTSDPYNGNIKCYGYKDKSVKILPANLPMPPTDTFEYMFACCEQLKDITALANWNVSKVWNMQRMFFHCVQLQDISALANWDVSGAGKMKEMFQWSGSIVNLHILANWNISWACETRDICRESGINWTKFPFKDSPPNPHERDHTSLLNSLWNRVKPLLKDTTKLNGYFKRYAISEPINDAVKSNETETSVKDDTIEQHDDIPKPNTLTVDLPSDW